MTTIVFVGPTIAAEEASMALDAVYLPPASQGDVYRAACRHPHALGIIDGFIESVPSVWHKEILWAMSTGVHVFGSASMGAIRAAELAPFGMVGVGAIFEAYRDGLLEDDDEVAVAHATVEFDYRPLSEAMISIRYTLAEAERQRVVSSATRLTLELIAKRLWYADRLYPAVLEIAARDAVSPAELNRLRSWLPTGRIDQKRQDALAMLRFMRLSLGTDPPPARVNFALERTVFWSRLTRTAGTIASEEAVNTDLDTGIFLAALRNVERTTSHERDGDVS